MEKGSRTNWQKGDLEVLGDQNLPRDLERDQVKRQVPR